MKFKMERVNLEIKNAVSQIISQMNDKRLANSFVTITEVKTAPDLFNAQILIGTIGGKNEEILKVLNSSKGYIRKELASKIRIRRVPEIYFVFDDTEQKASRIDELLAQINKK